MGAKIPVGLKTTPKNVVVGPETKVPPRKGAVSGSVETRPKTRPPTGVLQGGGSLAPASPPKTEEVKSQVSNLAKMNSDYFGSFSVIVATFL